MHSVSWTHRRMAHQGWAGTGQRGRLVDLQGMGQAHAQLDRAWDLACIACRAVLPDTDTRLEAHPVAGSAGAEWNGCQAKRAERQQCGANMQSAVHSPLQGASGLGRNWPGEQLG